ATRGSPGPWGARRRELWRRFCGTRGLVERVSAGARTVDVRVIDGEARLLQGLQPVDAASPEVGGRHPVHPHGDAIGHGLDVAVHGTVVEVERVPQARAATGLHGHAEEELGIARLVPDLVYLLR